MQMAIRSPRVQTFLAKQVAEYFSSELNTTIRVGQLSIGFFDEILMKELFIEDQQGDTLLYCSRLKVSFEAIRLKKREIEFDAIQLDNACFYLKTKMDSAGSNNLNFILSYFKPVNPDTISQGNWSLYSDDVWINNSAFKLKVGGEDTSQFGINYKDLDVREINCSLEKVELLHDTLYAYIEQIELMEKSGFELDTLNSNFTLSSSEIVLSNLKLVTPNSTINGEVNFEYSQFASFNSFIDSVQINTQFENTRLSFTDISYFAPTLEGFSEEIGISGKIRGPVSNLRGRKLKIEFSDESFFVGDFGLNGLPNIERTYINLDINKLSISTLDLEKIQIPPFKKNNRLNIPNEFEQMGNILFKGQFTGFYNDFVAFGDLRSAIGDLNMDIGISQDENTKVVSYSGQLKTSKFDLGKLFNIPDLGHLTSNVAVKGEGITYNTIRAEVIGEVNQAVFKGFSYEGLTLNAELEKDLFNGTAKMDNEHISFDFNGLIDLRADTSKFDFVSNVYHLNLGALNLVTIKGYSSLATKIEMNLKGLSFDDFAGKILASQVSFCHNDIEYPFGNVVFTSSRLGSGGEVTLLSTLADAQVKGQFELASLPGNFISVLKAAMPSLVDSDEVQRNKLHNFNFAVQIKDFSLVNELLVPGLFFENGSTISGQFNSSNVSLDLKLDAPLIMFKKLTFKDVHLEIDKKTDVLVSWLTAGQFPLADSLDFSNIDLRTSFYQDKIESDLTFIDQNYRESKVSIDGEILGPRKFDFDILPSNVDLLSQSWRNDSIASITVDTTSVTFTNFEIVSKYGLVSLEGTISEDLNEHLEFDLREVDLELVNHFGSETSPKISGVLNSKGTLDNAYSDNAINCFVDIRDLMVEDYELGEVMLDAKWDFQLAQLDLNGYLKYRQTENISINGIYSPKNEDNKLDATVSFNEFDLAILNYLIKGGVSEFEGSANGSVAVKGSFLEPLLSGELDFDNAGIKIDFLNTKYFLSSKVEISEDFIGLNYVPIKDEEGNNGFLIGTLFHENFRKLNYNFVVEMDRFLCLNTTVHDNDLFYGKAYASGTVDILGYDKNMQIEVTATTNIGSTFSMPLGGTTEVTFDNFVSFISASDDNESEEPVFDLEGISLVLDLRVTPDLLVEIVFDERLGDVIKARGSGPINLEITPDGSFSMFGRYEITEGDYLFTLQNIINKKFSIQKGGVIGWYGDPYNADIDLVAVYKLRASLYDLMGEFSDAYTSRVPVNLNLSLTNKLLNPNVDFSVSLPNSDESLQSLVNSVLSTEEEKNKQAFSLLVLNKFLPPSSRAATSASSSTGFGATTTTEVLSNQLSNWLSQISDDVDIGLNYRPGDNITNEELAVALSTQLLNDRLLISGSFGVSNSPAAASSDQSNQMIGDFLAEYLITEDGKLRLKVFSESADYSSLETYNTGTTQGVGLSFQEDFNNFADFACRLRNLIRGSNRKENCDDLY